MKEKALQSVDRPVCAALILSRLGVQLLLRLLLIVSPGPGHTHTRTHTHHTGLLQKIRDIEEDKQLAEHAKDSMVDQFGIMLQEKELVCAACLST